MDAFEARVYTALVIGCLLAVCLVVFFVASILRQQRQFNELQRQRFLREVDILEGERTRIARDLHDELGPLVSLVRLQLSTVEVPSAADAYELNDAGERLVQLTKRLGEISADLSPGILVRKGLQTAAERFLNELGERGGFHCQFRYTLSCEPPPAVSIHLYRLVQELGHNCLKHAGATHVLLYLDEQPTYRCLYYEDNGRGFSQRPYLRSLESRTAMLGGQLNSVSVPGKGVQIRIKLPFHERTIPD